MGVTRMTLSFGPPARRKPKCGDTKMLKGSLHIRRTRMLRDTDGRLCVWTRRGRELVEWVPIMTHKVYDL